MRTKDVNFGSALPIDGYAPQGFRVAGEVHLGAIVVSPDGVRKWGGLADLASVSDLAGRVDVLFLGTGATMMALDAETRSGLAKLESLGLGVETMSTPSACRTYNVVLSEGRRVACALIPVG